MSAAILVACCKERQEDAFIAKIRLESLLWATYINYALLLLVILLVYDTYFLEVMKWYMLTLLIMFLVRFHFVLYQASCESISFPLKKGAVRRFG